MKEYFIDKVFNEDCLQGLKSLPDNCVDCCVTSPPYYALRDYGVDGQIGLEQSPQAYIDKLTEVFMEVHRVLKNKGTLWLNIGDSYNGYKGNAKSEYNDSEFVGGHGGHPTRGGNFGLEDKSIKPKDLIGIPWALATALRQPYYNGKIKNEKDRVWLAAMLDSEGSITGSFHERSDGTGNRTQIGVCITNANTDILSKCQEVYGFGSTTLHQKNGIGHLGKRDIYRWNVNGVAEKQNIICELYPYLIAKRKQAIFAYNFFLLQKDAKKIGHSDKKDETNEKRKFIVEQISLLNKGNDVDIPTWCIEPPTLYTKGWYLRQDIIWAKGNPMPESVTDRCTKSHEYIFLMSKSQKYYFDNEAIQEQAVTQIQGQYLGTRGERGYSSASGNQRDCNGGFPMRTTNIKFGGNKYGKNEDRHFQTYSGKEWQPKYTEEDVMVRNKRDVWTVNVKPDSVAHFATYPEDLIIPCILAGCPSGGLVLDPFMGSGTTARVARKLNRHFVGFELNPDYCKIIEKKIQVEGDLFY